MVAPVRLNAFDNVDFGGFGSGSDTTEGYSQTQPRVDVTPANSWPATPQMTILASGRQGGLYVAIVTTTAVLFYAGPPQADHATDLTFWEERALPLPANSRIRVTVNAGDFVAVRNDV